MVAIEFIMVAILDEYGELASDGFCKILGKLTGIVVKLDWSVLSPRLNCHTRELTVPAADPSYIASVVASAVIRASVNTPEAPSPLEIQLADELLYKAKSFASQ